MTARLVRHVLSLAAPVLLVGVSGCSLWPFGKPTEPALVVQSQPRGDGSSVEIASFTLTQPGYVVVHADGGGKPGDVIGRTGLVQAGTFDDVEIAIEPSRAGDRVYPMLHDDDGDGVYEFPGPDGPTMFAGSTLFAPVVWQ